VRRWDHLAAYCLAALGLLSLAMVLVFGSSPGMAQPRAHVYLFRGLADVFSLGMKAPSFLSVTRWGPTPSWRWRTT
jgi:hypothetical protein